MTEQVDIPTLGGWAAARVMQQLPKRWRIAHMNVVPFADDEARIVEGYNVEFTFEKISMHPSWRGPSVLDIIDLGQALLPLCNAEDETNDSIVLAGKRYWIGDGDDSLAVQSIGQNKFSIWVRAWPDEEDTSDEDAETVQDSALWDEILANPDETIGLIRNSVEMFSGAVEPRHADVALINRLLSILGKPRLDME